MATGIDGGLLDAPKPQSVYKHGILDQHAIRFAVMTASKLNPRRAVVVDGFAGRGRFDGGEAGSAEFLMLHAQKMKASTQIVPFLIEKDPANFARLTEVADEYRARGIDVQTRLGECGDHLAEAIALAKGSSLFLFIDPCGATLPYRHLKPLLAGRGTWPPTELLMNFNADLVRRAGGQFKKGQLDAGGVASLDQVCGGDWWREVALQAHLNSGGKDWATAAQEVAEQYAIRLGRDTGMSAVVAPVRRKAHHQPVYFLIFLTRSPHGHWVFGDAASKARELWLQSLGPDEEELEGMLFNTVENQIAEERDRAVDVIKANIRKVVADGQPKAVVQHVGAIFEGVYGEARETTFSKALRELAAVGEVSYVDKGKKPYQHRIQQA